MSDAISLLSVPSGAKPSGSTAWSAAATGFEALFQLDGASAGEPDTEAANGSGTDALKTTDALKKMYGFLAGLGKKATYLEPESDAPAATLEAVAGLASDLAEALGSFERETGVGLLPLLEAGTLDGDLSVSSTEGDVAATLADPQAAVQALLSVISTVTGAVRRVSDLAAAQQSEGGFAPGRRAVSPDMSGVIAAAAPSAAAAAGAAVSATAGLGAKGATGRVGGIASTSLDPGAVVSIAPATVSVGAEVAATSDTEVPGLPVFFAPIQGGRSGDGNAPATQALLARVMAAAAEVSQTAGVGPLAAALAEAGGGVLRPSPVEPLITPEDIARAMARGGHPAGDSATTTTQGRSESGAEPSRFAAALAAQVRSAEVGDGHTRIALSPRGLGSIEVDVSTGEDGALKIVVRAENPAVLNSLRDERDLLAQALGGMDTGSLDLQSFADRDGQEPQGNRPPVLSARPGEDAAEGGADPGLVQTAEIGEGRLDIVT
ncbi:flagellar hook-length control protein FliK [Antarcticimicrobium sediminis]|uniref:Flagellar hook-length control protein FliK n=1 Tax=Antarcticimicrobium sediminis TaxID=2546227 RepID=A0A4V2Z842_9RHOB|nr:flagellar hook-length control protein FliK [Antarcticimicrobium sediminis]TDE38876.1 flagellar hook-length control protein FliK [Antarcticimicrobium sediminis]